MIKRRMRQRGVMLVGVVMLMGFVGVVAALLTMHVSAAHQARRQRLYDSAARFANLSAAAYVRAHATEWLASPPAEPVELPIDALLPAKATGSCTCTVIADQGATKCHIIARVKHPHVSSRATLDLTVGSD